MAATLDKITAEIKQIGKTRVTTVSRAGPLGQ
jgi:hypothetical protein